MNRMDKRILLVEDDKISLEFMRKLLESKGFFVETAMNGLEALEKLNADANFDLVVTDCVMPKMDGLCLLKKIKESETFKYIPVLMITCLSKLDDIIQAMQVGAFEYLIKPVKPSVLLDLIERGFAVSNKNNESVRVLDRMTI